MNAPATNKRNKQPQQKLTFADLATCNRALNAKEVAEIFGVNRLTVYSHARAHRLPSFKICGCLRFDPRALAKHIGEVR